MPGAVRTCTSHEIRTLLEPKSLRSHLGARNPQRSDGWKFATDLMANAEFRRPETFPPEMRRHASDSRTTTVGQTPRTGSEPAGLVELFRTLRQRRLIVLACVVAGVALAAAITAIVPKQYSATAELYFHDPMLTQQLLGSTVGGPTQDPTRAAATNVGLVELRTVAARAATHFQHLTASQVASEVAAASEGDSDLVSVTATDANPSTATKLANAFAAEFVRFRRDFDRGTIVATLRLMAHEKAGLSPAQRAGPEGRSLSNNADRLRVLESLQTGNVALVQQASAPTSPSSPRPISDIVFGLIAGLLLGVGVSVMVDRLDRKVRDPTEMQHLFARPLLGLIPDFGGKGSRRKGSSPTPVVADPRIAEAFRLLRTNLRYFRLDRPVSVVVTTSPEPGDGKTTISWNLAAAAAAAREKVLLIEADLRRPLPANDASAGLVHVLFGDEDFADALVSRSAGPGEATFDVLPAGDTPPNPADLLESSAMSELLRSARVRYDLVILDCTPITFVADAIPLLRAADGVIVVVSVAKTTTDNCRQLRLELDELQAPVLGVVANRIPIREQAYGNYYSAPRSTGRSDGSDTRAGEVMRTPAERG